MMKLLQMIFLTLSLLSSNIWGRSITEFREQIFLHCGMNLSIFKLSVQTQAAFWFMLFN